MMAERTILVQGRVIRAPVFGDGARGVVINGRPLVELLHPTGDTYFAPGTADEIRDRSLERKIIESVGHIIPRGAPPEIASAVFSGTRNRPSRPINEEVDPDSLLRRLRESGLSPEMSPIYGDITVTGGEGWGYIINANMRERFSRVQLPSSSYEGVSDLQVFVEEAMEKGILVSLESGRIDLFAPEYADRILTALDPETTHAATRQEVLNTVQQTFRSPEARRSAGDCLNVKPEDLPSKGQELPLHPTSRTAVIFQPHLTWQIAATGLYSAFPSQAQALLTNCGFARVSFEYDYGVTLELWRDTLLNAHQGRLVIIYNQGHGGPNKIFEGSDWRWDGFGTRYFNDQFVSTHANLPNSLVYVYSCQTRDNDRLSDAFLSGGADTYCGWLGPAPAYGPHCDLFDGEFWSPLMNGGTVGEGLDAVNEKGLNHVPTLGTLSSFEVVGNAQFRVQV